MQINDIKKFCDDRKKFSQKAFGSYTERGPDGPLTHLLDEVKEVLAEPKDKTEYADCFLLLVDAYDRAGLGDLFDLINQAKIKLEINKNRKWEKRGNIFKHV